MTIDASLRAIREPMDGERIVHGGRLDRARRMFPNAELPWVDLSTGVSPYAYPLPPLPPDVFTRLPDEEALAGLERIAARAYRAGADVEAVAGAGTQAFIRLLPRLWPARRALVLGFTYQEHAASWRAAGVETARADSLEAIEGADIAIVVNPNNPDGRLESPERLAALGERMARKGGLLIVDEAFMDMSGPSHSVAPRAAKAGILVLRSFGKAYGLPGLRLGFALCGAPLAGRLRRALGPWSVSGPAIVVGAAALADESWLAARAAELWRDAARLDALLAASGFELIGGALLFRLVAHERAANWFSHLGRRGILTRAFDGKPNWLRFGVPGTEPAWERLALALESFRGL